ncbi:hypothetical protein JXA84_02325 [candidate division WOR-3 bacterium]|nr:hypothetical protein [candidate division WOR-3 bacterium]
MPFMPFLMVLLGNPSGIPVTRWVGPGNPTSYAEWSSSFQTENQVSPANIDRRLSPGADLVEIIVESGLYPFIASEISLLSADIAAEGFSVSVDTVQGVQSINACFTLRNFLISKISQDLVGAYFIGDVPISWYQMIDDWGSGPEGYEEFPCDLFYMDLDGTWEDDSTWTSPNNYLSPGQDGIFDVHEGNTSPEIWVGRLFLSSLGDEDSLGKIYLRRSHLYRTDSFQSVSRGLSYVDDDWAYWAQEYKANMQEAYSDVTSVSQIDTTNPVNYKEHLSSTYEWVGIFCHSSPSLHSFKVSGGTSWSDMYASEIPVLKPYGLFYNLFACSNARYIEHNFMGGMYILKTPSGLGSIGTTKTGSMLNFYHFYSPLGLGQTTGEAFLSWFQFIATNGFTIEEKSWHYGMTLIGDPTLKLKPAGPFLKIALISANDSSGNGDGRIDQGEEAVLSFSVYNHLFSQNATNIQAALVSLDSFLTVTASSSSCPVINPGDTIENAFSFSVEGAASFTPHNADIVLYMNDGFSGRVTAETSQIFIGRQPILVIDDDGGMTSEEALTQSLNSLGRGFEIIERENYPSLTDIINSYSMVIWLTGSSSTGTLTAQDQNDVIDYFNLSGKLFLYGQGIAEELNGSAFLSSFLEVSWQGNTSVHFQTGTSNDPIGDSLSIATSNQTSQDMLTSTGNSSVSFSYQTTPQGASMIRKEGAGKIVFAGFGFEGVVSNVPGYAHRDTLLARIIDYMDLTVEVEEEKPSSEDFEFFMTQEADRIYFNLPKEFEGNITVKIFDVLGRNIITVNPGSASDQRIFWNFRDFKGQRVRAGSYFAVILTDSGLFSAKFSILH